MVPIYISYTTLYLFAIVTILHHFWAVWRSKYRDLEI